MIISSLEGTSVSTWLRDLVRDQKRKARTSLLYSTQHVVQILSRMLNNKYLFVDPISGCNHVIEAYSKVE